MIPRRIARPMLAAWFVTEGTAAVRGSAAHLVPARAGVDALAEQVGFARPSDPQLRTIVQVHGGLTVAAGAALALGKAPRVAAVLLALLTFPSVVANLLASRSGTTSAEAKAEQQQRALRARSLHRRRPHRRPATARAARVWRGRCRTPGSSPPPGRRPGVAGLAKGGAKAAGTATKASAETGAKAVKHAKKTEAAAVELGPARPRRRPRSRRRRLPPRPPRSTPSTRRRTGRSGRGRGPRPRPRQLAEREDAKAAKIAERAIARAVKIAEAEAARAEKAAGVAERAEAKAVEGQPPDPARRGQGRGARGRADVEDVVVVA